MLPHRNFESYLRYDKAGLMEGLQHLSIILKDKRDNAYLSAGHADFDSVVSKRKGSGTRLGGAQSWIAHLNGGTG